MSNGRGLRRFRTTKEFAGHRPGGSTGRLSDWKNNGFLETWMHTSLLPMALTRHSVPMPTAYKDKKTKKDVKRVFNKDLVCHESETVISQQYRTDRDDNTRRIVPPERCGLCKLVEWCRQQCIRFEQTRTKKDKFKKGIEFTTPMFAFESDDPKDARTIHIGGVCNLLNKQDKHNDAQRAAIAEAGIRVDEAFKENFYAKTSYVVAVVDDAAPEKGVQVDAVNQSLGEAIQEQLDKRLDKGVDIQKRPYCIKWEYDKTKPPMKQYSAEAIHHTEKKPNGRILALIRGPEPEIPSHFTELHNQASVRAVLERACMLPKGTVPWDELFPTKEQEAKWAEEDAKAAAAEEALAKEKGDDSEDEEAETEEDEEEAEYDADGDEIAACANEKCKKPMKMKADECPHCGEKYDVEDEESDDEDEEEEAPKAAKKTAAKKPEPPAPKKVRKAKAKSAAKNGAATKPKDDEEEESDEAEDEDDEPADLDVPF